MAVHTVTQPASDASSGRVKKTSALWQVLRGQRGEPDPQTQTTPPRRDTSDRATQILPDQTVRVEVIEHHTPAQLDPRPVLAAIVKDCTDALSGSTSPQSALLKVRTHEQALDFRLTQARRQSGNLIGAVALAEDAEAADRGGLVPPAGTAEFDRLAAQNAVTMTRRALHASAPEEETGFIPVARLGDELPPPAAPPTGLVADRAGVVHRQYPGVHLAFPACAGWELFRQAQANEVGFLPTRREMTCARNACVEASALPPQPEREPESDLAPAVTVDGPASPVHVPGDGTTPPLPESDADETADPGADAPHATALPKRTPHPVHIMPAPMSDGENPQPIGLHPRKPAYGEVHGGDWVFDDSADAAVLKLVKQVTVVRSGSGDPVSARVFFEDGSDRRVKGDRTVRVLGAADAVALLERYGAQVAQLEAAS